MYKAFGFQIISGQLDIDSILELIQKFTATRDISLQLFDARFIYGQEHLNSAFEHAARAFSESRGHSSSIAMEILLYASGEDQIKLAINKLGIKKDSKEIVIIIIDDKDTDEKLINEIIELFKSLGVEVNRDDDVITGDMNTLEEFGISDKELAAVPESRWFELVLEKVALVDIKK